MKFAMRELAAKLKCDNVESLAEAIYTAKKLAEKEKKDAKVDEETEAKHDDGDRERRPRVRGGRTKQLAVIRSMMRDLNVFG